jgi:putative membrane protein
VVNDFSEQDLQRLNSAVREAERRTRGEIVPMVVPASGRYRESAYLIGLISALVCLAVLLILSSRQWQATPYRSGMMIVGVTLAYVAGRRLGSLPTVIRMVVPEERMNLNVRRRAELAFYQHGLNKTREGTGILIMISLLERRVQVLADKGINEKVPSGIWNHLVEELIQHIKAGRTSDGLSRAITQCGDLLARYFPAKEKDNPDELRDDVIREP